MPRLGHQGHRLGVVLSADPTYRISPGQRGICIWKVCISGREGKRLTGSLVVQASSGDPRDEHSVTLSIAAKRCKVVTGQLIDGTGITATTKSTNAMRLNRPVGDSR